MRYEPPGATIDVAVSLAPTGLVGTMAVRLMKVVTGGDDSTAVARATNGIVENPAGSGIYQATITLPNEIGDYYPVWDNGSSFTRDDETIRVTYNAPSPAGAVGAPYFTVEEFRAEYPDNDEVAALEDERIEAKRAGAEEIIEGLDTEGGTHQAFVPRTETFELHGSCIEIPRYRVRTIEALSIDGDEVDVEGLELDGRRILGLRWNGPVSVTVTHGWDAPPLRIKDAAILLTYHRAVKGPIDDRATGRLTPDGSVLTLSTPGLRGAVTGLPEVDAAIGQYFKRRLTPTSVHIGEGPVDSFGSGWREGVWP